MTLHQETQTILRQPIAVIAFAAVGMAVFLGIKEFQQGTEGAVALVIPAVLLVFVTSIHLRSRLDEDGLTLFLFPIWRRRIALADIESVEPVTYRPLRDFGGWGLRGALSKEYWGTTVYSMSGKHGVRIRVRGARDVLLGTAHSRDWVLAFESAGVVVQNGTTDIEF